MATTSQKIILFIREHRKARPSVIDRRILLQRLYCETDEIKFLVLTLGARTPAPSNDDPVK